MRIKTRTIILTVICGLSFLSVCSASAQEIHLDKTGHAIIGLQSDDTDGCQDGSCNLSEHGGQNNGG